MQPNELKAYFDANPELLRQALNALCDALSDESAAGSLGFSPTAGIPVTTLQAALEHLHGLLADAVVGKLPTGSVTGDKLAQDVRDRFSAIESAAVTEVNDRTSADSNLQSQITALDVAKCEVYIGTYEGNSAAQRTISLGFRPRAVILTDDQSRFVSGSFSYGGIALDGYPAIGGLLTIVDNGFTVLHNYDSFHYLNTPGTTYYYFAFK